MTSEHSNFAARMRGLINSEGRVTPGPDLEIPIEDGGSYNSTLQTEEGFNSLALELFALQFAHNGPYRRLCEARGVLPESVEHWTRIPAVPTTAFKELDLTCLRVTERPRVFLSSGTTEHRPSRHFHNAESLAVYEASSLAWFRLHVASTGRLLILTPPATEAPNSSLVHMFETLHRESGWPESVFVGRTGNEGAWTIDFDAALAALDGSRRREEADSLASGVSPPPHVGGAAPLLVLGTAFSFVQLLDFLAERNLQFQLPRRSCVMETGGYKGRSRSLPKAELHAFISERLGVPRSHILCEYGMSELSSQAYDSAVRKEPTPDRSLEGNGPPAPCDPFPSWGGVRGGSAESAFRHSSPVTRHFHFPPWARVQIVSPETGRAVADRETGLICVFDLANVFSVMAIQTEDLGIRRDDGFELIGRAALAEPRGCSLRAV